jgi:hypothetical protein
MHGDDIAVRALLDSGKASATDTDDDGVTPLHVQLPSSSPSPS